MLEALKLILPHPHVLWPCGGLFLFRMHNTNITDTSTCEDCSLGGEGGGVDGDWGCFTWNVQH